MNQYLNLTRFGRLLRKHTTEHFPSYALGAAVLLGGLLAVLGFLSYLAGGLGQNTQAALFQLGVVGAGSFFASLGLAQYGVGSRAALALTLPASQLEKFLVAWLFSGPVFLVVYTAAFYLADWLVLTLGGHADMLANLFSSAEWLQTTLLSFLLAQAVGLWGSIFFQRQQFVRTAFLVFALVVGLSLVNFQVLRALVGPQAGMALPLGAVHLRDGLTLSLPDAQTRWLGWLPVALVALLWPAAYARLTEKQL